MKKVGIFLTLFVTLVTIGSECLYSMRRPIPVRVVNQPQPRRSRSSRIGRSLGNTLVNTAVNVAANRIANKSTRHAAKEARDTSAKVEQKVDQIRYDMQQQSDNNKFNLLLALLGLMFMVSVGMFFMLLRTKKAKK